VTWSALRISRCLLARNGHGQSRLPDAGHRHSRQLAARSLATHASHVVDDAGSRRACPTEPTTRAATFAESRSHRGSPKLGMVKDSALSIAHID
jgi:hypothetical protein